MALHTELEIYAACFDLLGEAGGVVLHMRRDVKSLFGGKIIEACIELDLHLRDANIAEDKEPHLQRLLRQLEIIELLTRTCRDHGYMPRSGYAKIIARTQSIGRQANGWRKHYKGGESQRQLPAHQGDHARALF